MIFRKMAFSIMSLVVSFLTLQVEDYAVRKKKSIKEIETWLSPILAYERDEI